MDKSKYDKEIAVRSSLGGALIGLLFSDTTLGNALGVSPALAAMTGVILGPIVDALIFKLKAWVAHVTQYQYPEDP